MRVEFEEQTREGESLLYCLHMVSSLGVGGSFPNRFLLVFTPYVFQYLIDFLYAVEEVRRVICVGIRRERDARDGFTHAHRVHREVFPIDLFILFSIFLLYTHSETQSNFIDSNPFISGG